MASSARTKIVPPTPPRTRYEDDLYTWVGEQVALLRAGKVSEIDGRNIAEELSDVGNEQLDKLEGAIAVLTMHLLKWDHQSKRRSRSWLATINEQRRRIQRVLRKNPGLKPLVAEAMSEGYADGRDRAVAETGLAYETFPQTCPYSFDAMMTRPIDDVPPTTTRKKRK